MHHFKAAIAGILTLLAAATASAQTFPTVPSQTVIGRTAVGTGPAQAIPFASLLTAMLTSPLTVSQVNVNSIVFAGATSGSVTVSAQSVAGTPTIKWPTNSGTVVTSATAPLEENAVTGVVSCPNCAIAISTRTAAAAQDLSAYTIVRTLGYATAGDGGNATFVKISAGTAFKDSFITAASLTSGGVTCPNGTYNGIALVQGTGRGAWVTLTVAGTVVTNVVLNNPGNQYTVGDVLTGGIGCGTDWTYTVTSVSTPLASFTDSAGNKWQYTVDAGGLIDPRSFGAKFDCGSVGLTCDPTATNDFASIQAALYFANYHASKTLNVDTPTGYSNRVLLPQGAAKVCVSGTAYNTLVVPDSVVLEGISKFGSWLKQCDSDTATHHFVTLGVRGNQLACFGPQLRNMGLYAGLGSANVDIAMIYTNCAQQGIAINDVAVYSIFRMCLLAEVGWGGASDFTANGLFCNINYQAPSQTSIIKNTYGGSTIKLHDIIIESGNNIAINGISIANTGGTYSIVNFHAEQISIPIFFNAAAGAGSTVGVLIQSITGGSGCTSLVKRNAGAAANRITLGTAVKSNCTNTYDNAGALTTTDVYNWVNF